jgi:hypothetical protein
MTNQYNLPTPAEALFMAYAIVRTPCSAAETERAKLLFEIAREMRVADDMRAIQRRREMVDALSRGIETQHARDKLSAAGIPHPAAYEPQVVPAFAAEASKAADRYAAMMRDAGYGGGPAAVTQVVSEQTQRLAVVWSLGDKSDCRHCHTQIIFVTRRMTDATSPGEDDSRTVWVHKYTDHRACAVPMMANDAEGVEGNYTFAEPIAKG